MPSINKMRQFILDAYPDSPYFRSKVVDMPNRQIIAIYNNIRKKQERDKKNKEVNSNFHQLDIWEYLTIKNEEEHGPGTHTNIE